jgi:hypothetical protein
MRLPLVTRGVPKRSLFQMLLCGECYEHVDTGIEWWIVCLSLSVKCRSQDIAREHTNRQTCQSSSTLLSTLANAPENKTSPSSKEIVSSLPKIVASTLQVYPSHKQPQPPCSPQRTADDTELNSTNIERESMAGSVRGWTVALRGKHWCAAHY